MTKFRLIFSALIATASFALGQNAQAQQTPAVSAETTNSPPPAWFARVNNTEVAVAHYDEAAREAFRNKFFHGKPPEAELNWMLREVGEMIIDQLLLQREVEQRKLEADESEVKNEIEKLDRQYANNPAWIQQREQTLPNLRQHLERKSRVAILERSIRSVTVSSAEVRAYYDKNLELFTEPEKNKLSLILFRIDPSSPRELWEQAQKRAQDTKAEILAGADFAKLAKERSNDHSAPNGGDLGYLHQGMLSPVIEAELSKVKPGELGGPTRTLEGYVVYRLDGRIPANLRDFSTVESRAKELLLRKKSDDTWLSFLDSLRQTAKIEVSPAFEKIMQTPKPGTTSIR